MRKVLLTTDGSEASLQAGRFLARLPHEEKLELTVVSVLTPPYQGRTALQHEWIETYLEQDREHVKKAYAEIETLFTGANASIEHVVVKGHAGDKICELAESRGCDLVVIGAKGHSTVSRILLGSTSDYIATKACCSVLVVRPANRARLTHPLRIVLGYEETGPAEAALEEISEIQWGKQVECHLVTVTYLNGLLGPEEVQATREAGRHAAAELREAGINAEAYLIENEHLGEGLVKYAEDHDCDILVVGETPRSRLGRVLMGSASRYVLRHVPCSVWITRNRIIHKAERFKNIPAPTGHQQPEVAVTTEVLIEGLKQPQAYAHRVESEIEIHETHISIVFLAGDFAYKLKKSIKTEFLDYSTLELRRHYCGEEVRLDSRYAGDMYLGVVPIGWENGELRVDCESEPIEYAVKMRRFPKGALLSERLASGDLTTMEVHQLADAVALFHQNAVVCTPELAAGWPDYFAKNMEQLIVELQTKVNPETATTLRVLNQWMRKYFEEHSATFSHRVENGFIRECHGDLHLQNVVHWGDRLIPFDGIEFNERLRWIDVLCDAAFLEMDLAYRGHLNLSRTFMNAYLERSGDYQSLTILRPFLIYRSLIRALVASIRLNQSHLTSCERDAVTRDVRQHIDLAYRFSLKEEPSLWITHGVSGSGKTTLSEEIVQRHEAFRLRSDLERKRLYGLQATERPSAELKVKMYSAEANKKTYLRLESLARAILHAGYSVIVDATFLKHRDRDRFHAMAQQEGVRFAILDYGSDEQTLRQRVADRMAKNHDASDADLQVLESQLASREPLTEAERRRVVHIPDLAEIAGKV